MIQSGRKLKFEKVPLSEESSIVLTPSSGPLLECSLHYHPELEITMVLSGSGQALFGSNLTAFHPGDLALIGSSVPHLYISVPDDSGRPAETWALKFDSRVTECGLLNLPEFKEVAAMLRENRSATIFPNAPEFRQDFARLAAAAGADRMLAFLELLVRMSRKPKQVLQENVAPPRRLWSSDREPVERAVRFLQQHFREKLSLRDVAEAAGMEQESFRRFFRRTVQVSFSDYLIELRLVCAGRLLRETSRSISGIAEASGFRNLANFNRLFSRRRGLSPREYRKLCTCPEVPPVRSGRTGVPQTSAGGTRGK